MKNNNTVIFFGIILIVLVVILGFVIADRNSLKLIILPDNNVYLIKNDTFIKYNKDIKNKTKVTLLNGDKLSFTYIKGEVKFYNEKKEVEIEDNYKFAYTKKVNIENVKFDTDDLNLNELDNVKTILSNHGIDGYDNLSTTKITYNNKTLYFVTNLFEEYTYDKVFSFLYYFNEESDIIYLIEQVDSTENIYDLCIPSMNSIVKVDGKSNLIIDCSYYSEIGTKNYIYNENLVKVNN